MPEIEKGFTLIELMIVVAIIAVLAAIAVAPSGIYTARAQATEGLTLASSAKTGIVEFQDNNGTWPTNNSDAGIEEPADITGTYVSSVTVNLDEIAIVFNSGVHSGNTITLTAADQGGSISWVCEATVIPGSQLPSNCYGSDETAP
jgi:type IV pilus assembly protein PilA